MGAGKSLDLLKVAHNYLERGMQPLLLKPKIDTRDLNVIKTRVGIEMPCKTIADDFDVFSHIESIINNKSTNNHNRDSEQTKKPDCILIDEAQFLTVEQSKQLAQIVDLLNIPVICYGLRTNYMSEPFLASAWLLANADILEEIKTICHCGKKATHTMLVIDGQPVREGDTIVIESDAVDYISVCRKHWTAGSYSA